MPGELTPYSQLGGERIVHPARVRLVYCPHGRARERGCGTCAHEVDAALASMTGAPPSAATTDGDQGAPPRAATSNESTEER